MESRLAKIVEEKPIDVSEQQKANERIKEELTKMQEQFHDKMKSVYRKAFPGKYMYSFNPYMDGEPK